MPKEYQLKNSPINLNRLHKIAKSLVDEAKEDREKALQTFDYFKNIVENSMDGDAVCTAQKNMIDCLKLAQDSKNKVIKALDLILKTEGKYKSKDLDSELPDASSFSFDEFDK